MERIAFIIGENFIYWSAIVTTLGTAAAACLFVAFYVGKTGKGISAALAVQLSLILSLVFCRLVHWYCRADSYDSFFSAMTDYTSGGYALMGAFAGCALTAAVLRLLQFTKNLPEMLDCMCIAGSAGIGVGRLASFFNGSDRGQILQGVQSLPWVYPVTNVVSGVQEYRLATFVFQAMVALGLFAMLALFYIIGNKRGKLKSGDTCLVFLLCYGASQVVLDSTRYDSLFFRSNGFVSIVQVLSALAIGLALVVFSVRMVRSRGFRWWQPLLWLPLAGLIGGAGFMEYYVQRHGDQAVFAYSVMSGCLLAVIFLVLVIRMLGNAPKKAN